MNINNLPLPYRCAVEVLGSHGDISYGRLSGLCDAYAKSYGVDGSDEHKTHTANAWEVAKLAYSHRISTAQ